MLGSGFIGRFYADSILGQRSRDSIVSIYSRRKESAEKFARDYHLQTLDNGNGRVHRPPGSGPRMYLPAQQPARDRRSPLLQA
ncbi:Gfo/Idh/MocA family oxidoreductase [Puia sp. P3]|uniref:Gfo/Idh/MocA family oxidoreductase n=1 Tax=Puia sp. P3 TaxID=3423952 RepID=UPI003D67BC53